MTEPERRSHGIVGAREAGNVEPVLGSPPENETDWAEKIEIAKAAREAGSRLREGKSVAASPSISPYSSR